MASIKANIWKFYLFNIFSSFVLYYALDKVFMEARGLSVTEIVLVEIVYSAFVLFLEVPSGALSDRWSRKYVLALNAVFFMLNTFLWVIAHDVSLFLLGSMAASIHMAFRSGTDTSFLYDTLKQLNREGDYEKVYGKNLFYENSLAIVAGIAGGLIADYAGLEVPFWITLGFTFIAVLIALSFKEPDIHRTTGEMAYWEHIRETGKYVWQHPFIFHLIMISVVLGATLGLMDEYGQLYFVKIGLPVLVLGYLAAVGSGIEALAGRYAYVLSRFSRRNVFALAILISAIGFFVVGFTQSWIGVIFSFLPWIAFYFIHPLLTSDLHKELPSGQRATGESFANLTSEAFLIPVAFGFGFLADKISIFTAYTAIGVVVSIYFLVFLLFSYRKIGNGLKMKSVHKML